MKHHTLLPIILAGSVAGFTGCAQSTTAPMVEANHVPERPVPAVHIAQTEMAGNHRQPVPSRERVPPKQKKPWKVIDRANSEAAQNPIEEGYFNAIMQYDFTPGYLYQVYTAPLRLTDIQLQPGEKIVGTPAAGDTVRWVVGVGRSMQNGIEQQHIYVKPVKPGLHTTLIVTTDRRTYHIELHSYRETWMASVAWNYPHESMQQFLADRQMTTAGHVDVEKLHFDYKIDVRKGSRPFWMPVKVFDDGRKTFIQFPEEMMRREAPALFVTGADGKAQLVNYRMKNQYYIVDRLFDKAELRLGQQEQQIVRIVRK